MVVFTISRKTALLVFHAREFRSKCNYHRPCFLGGFPGGSDGKVSACNAGDPGSIPRLGRSPGEGNAIHSSILAWRIPWTEEPGELQSIGS